MAHNLERWKRIEQLLDQVLDQPEARERAREAKVMRGRAMRFQNVDTRSGRSTADNLASNPSGILQVF